MIAKNRMIPAFDRDHHEEIRAHDGANFLPHCSNHAGLCSWASVPTPDCCEFAGENGLL